MANDKDDDDKDLTVVEDESGEGEAVVVDEQAADERLSNEDEDEGDDSAATEAIRAQRRIERKNKKLREHAARERTQKELNLLRNRNEELERERSQYDHRLRQLESRTSNTEVGSIDAQLATIESNLRDADSIRSVAISKNDGPTAVEAENARDVLRSQRDRLLAQKDHIARQARESEGRGTERGTEETTRRQPPRANPEVVAHATAWKQANPWFKADRSDRDSAVVAGIDDGLLAEGFDPANQDYWDELNSRSKEVLPHRFGGDEDRGRSNGSGRSNGGGNTRSNEGGPRMANGARERQLKPGEVYVSKERKEALIAAGAWDDPKLRARYLKSYQKYDEEAAANAS